MSPWRKDSASWIDRWNDEGVLRPVGARLLDIEGPPQRLSALRRPRRLSKNPRRAREGRSPLEFQSYPAACTPGAGDFCGGKFHFPEQKSIPCSFCARKSERCQQKRWFLPTQLAKTSRFATEWLILSHSPLERVVVAGELASPSTSLSKPILTS